MAVRPAGGEGRSTLNTSARSWEESDMGQAPSAYEALTMVAILVSRGGGKPAYHADFSYFMGPLYGILHVANREVVIEIVIKVGRLAHMLWIAVGEVDASLLPP